MRRCCEHKQKKINGFTQKYNVDKLIYFERFDSIDSAIAREKQIKGFSKEKKLALINKVNIDWKELLHTGLFNDWEIPHSSTLYPWRSISTQCGFVRDDTFLGVYRGEGSSGDSVFILSENQFSDESPLFPYPFSPLNS